LGKQILAFIEKSVKKYTFFSALFFCGGKQRPTVTMVIYFAYTELTSVDSRRNSMKSEAAKKNTYFIGSLTCGTEYDTNQGNFVST
jgi:hypothetical protein